MIETTRIHPGLFLLAAAVMALTAACGSPDDNGEEDREGNAGAALTEGAGADAAQVCVDKINQLRATLGLPAYARWSDTEACVGEEAKTDYQNNKPHSAFGHCKEWAQDECPNWPGPPDAMIGNCLQMMWNEGPGDPHQGHGHYMIMSSKQYTKVACGFYTTPSGRVWATQDFK